MLLSITMSLSPTSNMWFSVMLWSKDLKDESGQKTHLQKPSQMSLENKWCQRKTRQVLIAAFSYHPYRANDPWASEYFSSLLGKANMLVTVINWRVFFQSVIISRRQSVHGPLTWVKVPTTLDVILHLHSILSVSNAVSKLDLKLVTKSIRTPGALSFQRNPATWQFFLESAHWSYILRKSTIYYFQRQNFPICCVAVSL